LIATDLLDCSHLNTLWLKDDSLEGSVNLHLPEPGMLALEITEDREAVLLQFAMITEDLAVEPSVR
jgi:hypothetical protein